MSIVPLTVPLLHADANKTVSSGSVTINGDQTVQVLAEEAAPLSDIDAAVRLRLLRVCFLSLVV